MQNIITQCSLFFSLFFTIIPTHAMKIKYQSFNNKDNIYYIQRSEYEFEKTLKAQKGAPKQVVFDPNDSNIIYSGSSDNTVKIWDINNNRCTDLERPNDGKSQKSDIIAVNHDGTILATTGYSNEIILFDIVKKKYIKNVTVNGEQKVKVKSLSFNHKRSSILAAGLKRDSDIYEQSINAVTIFNTENNDQHTFSDNISDLQQVIMNPHDKKNLIILTDEALLFYDIETKKLIRNVYKNPQALYENRKAVFHPSDNIFLVSKYQKPFKRRSECLDIWDPRQQKITKQIKTNGFEKYGVIDFDIHPNGKEIIATSYRLTQIIDFGTGKTVQTFSNESSSCGDCFCSSSINSPKHNSEIKQVAVSHDGNNVATVAGTIKIWNRD